MKFKIHVKQVGGSSWWEEYDKPGTDADKLAKDIVDGCWNASLRPHEKRREILEVVVLDDRETTATHKWEKFGAVTVISRSHLPYDTYRCVACGITAKRFGLSESIVIDKKYRAKFYHNCGEVIKRRAAAAQPPRSEA